MFKNIFFFSLIFTALVFTGCHEELLFPEPPSNITTANFYKTAKDIDMGVIAIYGRLQYRKARVQSMENSDLTFMELPGDNMYKGTWARHYEHVDEWNCLPTSTGMDYMWTQSYSGIFYANSVLENIDNPVNYVAGEKEKYLGEAKFMRALFYFDLVRLYGGVPRIDKTVSIADSRKVGRAPEADIYNLIVEDLKAAVDNLPAQNTPGRASKGAAVALLAKVYVYLKDWSNAKIYFEKLFSEFNFELLPDVTNILKTEDNKELIFVVKYVDGTYGQFLSKEGLPYQGIFKVLKDGGNWCPSWDLLKRFDPEDTRKEAAITEMWKSYATKEADEPIWNPWINKWFVPERMNVATTVGCELDIPVLRLGDMILLYAETLYELNQTGPALVQLNRIRERAFNGSTHNYSDSDIPNKEAWLEKLHLERRFELCFEGERWFDLVRSGLYLNLHEYETYNDGQGVILKRKLDPKPWKKYFPIPQSEIDQYDPGVLVQNEGYD